MLSFRDALVELQFRLIFWNDDLISSRNSLTTKEKRQVFRVAATFLTQTNYKAIVEERSVNLNCGYPLCTNKVSSTKSIGEKCLFTSF